MKHYQARTVTSNAPRINLHNSIIKIHARNTLFTPPSVISHPALHVLSSTRNPSLVIVRYRKSSDVYEDEVVFDGETEWDTDVSTLSTQSIIQQSMRAIGLVTDRLTDIALQFAPEDASPQVVRTALSGGLILLAISFVKGIISFFLTLGTIALSAYVAVRVFGLDPSSMSYSDSNTSRTTKNKNRKKSSKNQQRNRGRSPSTTTTSSVVGLIGGLLNSGDVSDADEDSGLLDVWFMEKKGRKNNNGSSQKRK